MVSYQHSCILFQLLYWGIIYCPLWGYHASGLKILVEHKIDFDNKKNLLIASVILVSGIGGLMIDLGGLQITGGKFNHSWYLALPNLARS